MSKKNTRATAVRRDVLNSPLLRKCSVHQKSRKVQRRNDKAALRKQCCPQSTLGCVLRAALSTLASNLVSNLASKRPLVSVCA